MSESVILTRRERLAFREWLRMVDPRCAYCGRYLKIRRATLDHVIPLSKGGTHHVNNLVLSCAACNHAKADRSLRQWLADLEQALARIRTFSNEGEAPQ